MILKIACVFIVCVCVCYLLRRIGKKSDNEKYCKDAKQGNVKCSGNSAEQGDVDAQFKLGLHYFEGTGVSQDYAEAVKWFRKSAEQGDAAAQFCLGYCYEEGNGVLKDIPEAIKWYTKAAEQGDEEAAERIKLLKQEGEQ